MFTTAYSEIEDGCEDEIARYICRNKLFSKSKEVLTELRNEFRLVDDEECATNLKRKFRFLYQNKGINNLNIGFRRHSTRNSFA